MENKNTYFLKISGKVNIPVPLSIGHNYKLVTDASIVSELKIDNEDGSFDVVYKIIPITVQVAKDNGDFIKAKDPRRNSEKLRKWLWKHWSESEWVTEDFDEVYTKFTHEVMAQTPTILREAMK